MEVKRGNRYPTHPDYLAQLVGSKTSKRNPKPLARISARRLARAVDVAPSFIDRLVNGEVNSCSTRVAKAIARELDMNVHDIFMPSASRTSAQIATQKKAVATRIERAKASRQTEGIAA